MDLEPAQGGRVFGDGSGGELKPDEASVAPVAVAPVVAPEPKPSPPEIVRGTSRRATLGPAPIKRPEGHWFPATAPRDSQNPPFPPL
jgi:hypothetical protein